MSFVKHLKFQITNFYQRHEVLVAIGFFVAGFLFDLLTLGRIDDPLTLLQQGFYLIVLGTLLVFEIRVKVGSFKLSEKGSQFWKYHDLVVHFFFGSLLSIYTIFYYSSASALTSFLFIFLLAGLMLANEIPHFQRLGLPARVILFSICVLSFFSFFYPILIGHLGALPFWLGVLTSTGTLGLIWRLNFKGSDSIAYLKKNVLIPGIVVHIFFVAAYYTSFIPPVPMALKHIGVYYNVEKRDGHYIGSYLRPFWNFWSHGSQDFKTRDGDKIYILMSIFSPARFQDQIYLKWYYDDPRLGWTLQDSIPLSILGGRDDGYRGFGSKGHFQYGEWRVVVETSDRREIGRINFSVEADESNEARDFKKEIF